MSATVSIRRATDAERPVIERLLELYLYDLADVHWFPIGADGLYHYERLEEFWRHPYLLFSGDDIAGLALVIERCPITGREPCFFMAEFFVLRPYRGRGFGTAAAQQIVAAHRGPWHLAVMTANAPAMSFWQKLAAPFEARARHVTHDGEAWLLHEFES
jgi:predicted acetyltransferase